jgi:DNA-binding SARP family transcriptional activator/TolB-like protein/Tfp pilus assembly protein PilF
MATATPDASDGGYVRWSLKSAGSFAIFDISDGRDVTPRGRKARSIIAYLASRPDTRVPRERVAELLWGDRGEAQARASLRQALLEIRQAARGPPDLVQGDREHIWVNSAHVGHHGSLVEDANAGEFQVFEDLDHVSPEFDEWLDLERTRRTKEVLERLRARAEECLADGEEDTALPLIETMQRLDPYNEEVLRLAMQAESQAGHAAAIEQRFQTSTALLREELGVEPSAETKVLHDALLKGLKSDEASNDETVAFARDKSAPAESLIPRTLEPSIRFAGLASMPKWALALGILLLVIVAAAAVWWTFGSGGRLLASEPVKVAVLPFRAAGVDPDLADGFSEALLSRLANDDQFQVTGQTSSWQYKDRPADLRQVGRALNVDYVVEGSIRKSGEQLKITAALVRTTNHSTVWRHDFVGRESLPALEQAIKGGIAGALGMNVDKALAPSRQSKAYPLYLRAKSLFRARSASSMRRAKELLEEAVRLDPRHAPSWSLLGMTLTLFAGDTSGGDQPALMQIARARLMIERALRLDPNLAEAHAAMALNLGFEDDAGRRHLARALQISPNDPQILYWWSIAQQAAGYFDEWERALRKSQMLDPLWRRPAFGVALLAVDDGDLARADAILRSIRTYAPDGATELAMGIAMAKRDYSRAIEIGMSALPSLGDDFSSQSLLTDGLVALGYAEQAALIAAMPPASRALLTGKPISAGSIIDEVRRLGSPYGSDGYRLSLFAVERLSNDRRYADLVALYRSGVPPLNGLAHPRKGDAAILAIAGPDVALALIKTGQGGEARRMLAEIDEIAARCGANRRVDRDAEVAFAQADAIQGRRDAALARLEKVARSGWTWFPFELAPPTRLRNLPAFESLRGNPRFERLDRKFAAKWARERAEAAPFV